MEPGSRRAYLVKGQTRPIFREKVGPGCHTLSVIGVRCESEANGPDIALFRGGKVLRQPRKFAQQQWQNAGRHGVQRAQVSNRLLASDSAQFRHHIVAGHPTRLIDYQQSIHLTTLVDRGGSPSYPCRRTSDKNSARVSFCRKHPTIADVTVDELCFSIPRIIMHRCCASITTPTPCGAMAS